MVGNVQSTGASASYIKSTQLASSSSRSSEARVPDSASATRETRETERSETTRNTDSSSSVVKTSASTELSARNEDQTIATEQTRGSILDLAV